MGVGGDSGKKILRMMRRGVKDAVTGLRDLSTRRDCLRQALGPVFENFLDLESLKLGLKVVGGGQVGTTSFRIFPRGCVFAFITLLKREMWVRVMPTGRCRVEDPTTLRL